MAHLSVSRIKVIMKSSADADCVSKESVFVLTKATELFIKLLACEGYECTNTGKKLDYKDLARIVHSDEKYEFLREIMPKKITVAEYKRLMAAKGVKPPQLVEHSSTDDSDVEGSAQGKSDDEGNSKKPSPEKKPTETKDEDILEISSNDGD